MVQIKKYLAYFGVATVIACIAAFISWYYTAGYLKAKHEKEVSAINAVGLQSEIEDLKKAVKDSQDIIDKQIRDRLSLESTIKTNEEKFNSDINKLYASNARVRLKYGSCAKELSEASNTGTGIEESQPSIRTDSYARIRGAARQGDVWGHQLNHCIDAYNTIKEKYGENSANP